MLTSTPPGPLAVLWRNQRLPASAQWAGHGYCICSPDDTGRPVRLVAFIDGFDWQHATEVVIRFDRRKLPLDDAEIRRLKDAIAAWAQRRSPALHDFPCGLSGVANA